MSDKKEVDSLDDLDIDTSDIFEDMSAEEITNMALERIKAEREEKRAKQEEKKRKQVLAQRTAKLSDDECYKAYDKLMREFPSYEPNAVVHPSHWTSNLVRVLNIIEYKHNVSHLANPSSILGEPESMSHIAIVKSHLSAAIFDDIWAQLKDFSTANPNFNLESVPAVKESLSYTEGNRYAFDEKAESSSDPAWGSW